MRYGSYDNVKQKTHKTGKQFKLRQNRQKTIKIKQKMCNGCYATDKCHCWGI